MTELKQHTKISQELKLSPFIVLRGDILQANYLELLELLEIEMENNPVLSEENTEEEPDKTSDIEEFSSEDYFPDDSAYLFPIEDKKPETPFEDKLKELKYNLLIQVEKILPASDFKIAQYIIQNLNKEGYFENTNEKFNVEDVKRIKYIIGTKCTPLGMAAENIKERILFLLIVKGYNKTSVPFKIIEHCFDNFIHKNFKRISETLKVTGEDIEKTIKIIANLNIPIFHTYTKDIEGWVIPDLIITYTNNNWEVSVMEKNLPVIKIAGYVKKIINSPQKIDKETYKYLKEKYERVVNILKAKEERRQLLIKLGEILVEEFPEVLLYKKNIKHRLALTKLSNKLSVDLSILSRIVNGKYVSAPSGIYILKHFFALSGNEIKNQIKEIIYMEDPYSPLTDEEIAKMMSNFGIKIGRRMVSNYRKELSIPPASKRRIF